MQMHSSPLCQIQTLVHPDVTYVNAAYLGCELAGSVEVLQTDPTLPGHGIQLTGPLSHLVLKRAAPLNAQQTLGVCEAQTPQLWPN